MARRPSARSFGNIILVVLLGGVLVTQALQAVATHQPANKAASSASNVRDVTGVTGETTTILRETMKVSSPTDLILQTAAECALITSVTTGNEPGDQATDTSQAEAQIEVRITIDGETVPVDSTTGDDGWVVFCNRLYRQTATDAEGDGDIDRMDSYISSRTANAFNWFAFDVGAEYDKPDVPVGSSNNIVEVVVEARFTETATTEAVADALIGRRGIIVEPTHASNHEQTGAE